jgi:hypothetical protein
MKMEASEFLGERLNELFRLVVAISHRQIGAQRETPGTAVPID